MEGYFIMKTSELIAALQALDPNGELPVTVNNATILDAFVAPARMDGFLSVVTLDDVGTPSKVELVGSGDKVMLMTMDMKDAIADNPEVLMVYDDINDYEGLDTIIEQVNAHRNYYKNVHAITRVAP